VPEALFWYRVAPGSMIHTTPRAANYARSLRPYLEDAPALYRDLLRLAQGQALRLRQLQNEMGATKPLRYRVADHAHAWLSKVPLLPWLLRRLLKP
jgi:hypothetical protein